MASGTLAFVGESSVSEGYSFTGMHHIFDNSYHGVWAGGVRESVFVCEAQAMPCTVREDRDTVTQ